MISPNIDVQEYRQALGILANRSDTEQALQVLKDNEFPMEQVSVIVQDSELEDDIPPSVEIQSQIKSPVKKGAATGGTVGAISGLLVGLGTIAIPGLGPVMLAGVTATTLMTSILGAATGGLIGALVRMRIPEKDAAVYNNFVAKGYYILLVEGIMEEIQNAETILTSQEIQEWKVFFKPEQPRATKKNLS